MRVLVCGGRELDDRRLVFFRLARFHEGSRVTLLISGGCPDREKDGRLIRSTDSLAEEWAKRNEVDTLIRRAKWKDYGRAAGPMRNGVMEKDEPDLVIAFPGGRGTADMVKRARKAGIEVMEVEG